MDEKTLKRLLRERDSVTASLSHLAALTLSERTDADALLQGPELAYRRRQDEKENQLEIRLSILNYQIKVFERRIEYRRFGDEEAA